MVYTAEELLGMFFAMIKDMAEKDSESKVTNCMITVCPSGFIYVFSCLHLVFGIGYACFHRNN